MTVCISGWLRDAGDFGPALRRVAPVDVGPRDHVPVLLRVRSPRRAELRSRPRKVEGEGGRALLRVRGRVRQESQKAPAVRRRAEVRRVADRGGRRAGPWTSWFARSRDVGSRTKADEEPTQPADTATVDLLFSDALSGTDSPAKRPSDVALRSYGAWDFHARYGSELYVVRWEGRLLLELNGSVRDFQRDMAKEAGREILKKTAMASLLTAIAIPSALLSFSNILSAILTRGTEKETNKILMVSVAVADR